MFKHENLTNKEKVNNLLSQQERLPANLQKYDREKNQDFIEHNSVEKSKEEADYINELMLTDMEMETEEHLTEEDRIMLSNRQSLDYANILLNSNKKSDSDTMKDAKIDVEKLINVIEANKNQPLSAEGFDSIESAFAMAIKSLKHYLDTKNPHFKTGIERKRQVYELWTSLMYESMLFAKQRAYLKPDYEGDVPASFAALLGMNGGQDVTVLRPKEPVEYGPDNRPPEEITKTAAYFKPEYSFANDIKAKFSKAKDIASKAGEVKAFYEAAKKFTPGAVGLADINIMGKTVTLLQKSDNSVYIVKDHKEYPLGRSLVAMRMSIENEIFANPEVYGEQQIIYLLDQFESPEYQRTMNAGENNRIRTMLASFLAKKTGLVDNEFNNTFRRDMATFIRQYINKERTGEQIKNQVLEQAQNTVFVNGIAVSEMAQLNADKHDEIEKMVLMNKVEKLEIIEEGWSSDEVKVKEMIADLIYTTDTEKMDISVVEPGRFVKEILEKHKDALQILVAHKADESDFVKGILNKMSIADLSGELDGQPVNLDTIVAQSLNSLRDLKEAAGEGELSSDALAEVKRNLDDVVDKSCKILQSNVGVLSGAIFPEQEQQQENQQNLTLRERVEEASKSTKGQGKFMRNVFNNYFAKVNNIDKRAMLAAVFRSAKNVKPLELTNDDLIDDIKEKKITKYPGLLAKGGKTGEDGKVHYEVTPQEEALLNEYREYKQTLRKQANFLGGLIRGAGPLMHKMMQGIPTSALPDEIKEALKDVKSNLPPIPENLVKSELVSLVESSKGKLTKIEIVKSLGAASVGQAFLCKVYGPAKDMKKGKEVVIKLLRPEAKNRMQREEKIMLDAAQATDQAMFLTYKGQLDNYKKELDLSVEANNCKSGTIHYEGKDSFANVKSMKTLDGVPATATSLIIEKAEGTTLDKYIDELKEYPDTLLDSFYSKYQRGDGSVAVNKLEIRAHTPEKMDSLIEKKQLMLNKIDEAIKRRDHILNLCNIWIDKALMDRKCGFYHGDLHSGNIMINDNEATFIDYGNTVQLNENQQKALVQMALAASSSVEQEASEIPTDILFEAFNDLIKDNNDPDFQALYTEEKKQQLKAAFIEILHMGEQNEAGFRISLCISKAQEMGIMIPPALQNFSQGQIRLQNTIEEMNKAIEDMKKKVERIDYAGADVKSFDPVSIIKGRLHRQPKYGEKFKGQIKTMLPIDEAGFKQGILDNTVVEGDAEKGIKAINKREEFKNTFLGPYSKLLGKALGGAPAVPADEFQKMGLSIEQIQELGLDAQKLKPQEKTYRQMFEDYMKKYEGKQGTPEQLEEAKKIWQTLLPQGSLFTGALNVFGGRAFFNGAEKAVRDMDRNAMNVFLNVLEKNVPTAVFMQKKAEKLWEKLDNKNEKISEEEKTQKVDEIYADYEELHTEFAKKHEIFVNFEARLDNAFSDKKMEETMTSLFAITKNSIGERLRQKFEAYKKIKEKYPCIKKEDGGWEWKVGEDDKQAYETIKAEFKEVYYEACIERLTTYSEQMFSKEANVKFVDYDSVMEAVISKNFPRSNAIEGLATANKVRGWLGWKTLRMVTG